MVPCQGLQKAAMAGDFLYSIVALKGNGLIFAGKIPRPLLYAKGKL